MQKEFIFNPCLAGVGIDVICFPSVALVYNDVSITPDQRVNLQSFGAKIFKAGDTSGSEIRHYLYKFHMESEEIRIIMRFLCVVSSIPNDEYLRLGAEFKELFPYKTPLSIRGRPQLTAQPIRHLFHSHIRHIIQGFLSDSKVPSALLKYWKKQKTVVNRNRTLYDCHICIASMLTETFLQPTARVMQTSQPYGGLGLQLLKNVANGEFVALGHPFRTELQWLSGLKADKYISGGFGLFGCGYAVNARTDNNVEFRYLEVDVGELQPKCEPMKAADKLKFKAIIIEAKHKITLPKDGNDRVELFATYDIASNTKNKRCRCK